ncbi:MAG: hypothetical protein ACYC0H_23410, partial [Solirubrobacteraceae bacterium]
MSKIYISQSMIFIFVTIVLFSGNLYTKETFTCKGSDQITILNNDNLSETIYDIKSLLNSTFNLEACRKKNFKLLTYDVSKETLERLIAKLNCIAQWIDRTKKGSEKFNEDMLRLTNILDFVAIVIKNFDKLTDAQAKKFAQDVQGDIEKKLQQIISIDVSAFKIIDAATDNSKTWKNKVPKLSVFEKEGLLGKNGQYTHLL